MLPPYIELPLSFDAVRECFTGETPGQVHRCAEKAGVALAANPFHTFKSRFEIDLKWLLDESMDTFHAYSFATTPIWRLL
jgi:hypothetical protein